MRRLRQRVGPASLPARRPARASRRRATSSSPSASPSAVSSATPARSARPKVIGTDRHATSRCRGASPSSPTARRWSPSGTAAGCCGSTRTVGRARSAGSRRPRPRARAGCSAWRSPRRTPRDGRVFFYTTAESDNRVLRTTYDNGRLGAMRAGAHGIPKAFNHDGGRMVFGPDGDAVRLHRRGRASPSSPRTADSLGGKILRITPDGDPAPGNPDRGLADLDLGTPQRAGPGLRRQRQPVGLGVRAGHLGRAEPDREGPQLRLARGRGRGRRARAAPTRR